MSTTYSNVLGARVVRVAGRAESASRDVVTRVQRGALTAVTIDAILAAAEANTDVPTERDQWSTALPNLRVYGKSSEIVGLDDAEFRVRVHIEYRYMPPSTGYPLRGSGSAAQISTGKMPNGDAITTTYGGNAYKTPVSVYGSEAVEYRETTEESSRPDVIRWSWLNQLNSDPWMGDAAKMWRVHQIDYSPLCFKAIQGLQYWLFRWTFLRSPDPAGWQPVLIYRRADGTIPTDATFETKEYYSTKSFSEKFPYQVVGDA